MTNSTVEKAEQQKEWQAKLRWSCHRGMLELDMLLIPFFEQKFASLGEAEQHQFEQLLTSTDPELFAWLMGHEKPDSSEIQFLVDRIRQYHQK